MAVPEGSPPPPRQTQAEPPPTPPAPALGVPEELALLGQIMRRVDKLTPAGKRWLRDRLDTDTRGTPRDSTTLVT